MISWLVYLHNISGQWKWFALFTLLLFGVKNEPFRASAADNLPQPWMVWVSGSSVFMLFFYLFFFKGSCFINYCSWEYHPKRDFYLVWWHIQGQNIFFFCLVAITSVPFSNLQFCLLQILYVLGHKVPDKYSLCSNCCGGFHVTALQRKKHKHYCHKRRLKLIILWQHCFRN